MCYKKPGPRCASYALKHVKSAAETMHTAELNEDFDAWEKAMGKKEEAEFQYYMTNAGQELLQKRIARGKNVEKNTVLLQESASAREQALLAIGLAPKDYKKDVDFSHHNGERNKNNPQPISFDPDSVTVNESDLPHPQANRLDKVSTTVDAVMGGATTASGIAQTLGVVDRQGSYYANAAGYLGLVEEVQHEDFKEYSLTSLGQRFANADAAGREQLMRGQIQGMPLMQVYNEEGVDAAKDFMQATKDSSDSTVDRRIATLNAWSEALGSEAFSRDIHSDREEGRARVMSAAEYVAEQRKKHSARTSATPQAAVCPQCFTQMSLTGVCSNCAE